MSLSNSALKGLIVGEMTAQGIEVAGDHAWAEKLAEAVANAVVAHITASAQVTVSGGSSAGTYKVA